MKWSPEQKVTAGFALALLLLLTIGAVACRSAVRSLETYRWVDHTRETLLQLRAVSIDLLDLETGARGFALTGDEFFLKHCAQANLAMDEALKALRALLQDNPAQTQKLARLEPLLRQKRDWASEVIAARKEQGLEASAQKTASRQGATLMDQVRALVGDLENTEEQLLRVRSASAQAEARTAIGIVAVATLTGVAVTALAGLLLRQDFHMRKDAELNVRRLNVELEKQTVQLVDANRELEAFAYSVSHDLRSPVRSIAGYTSCLLENNAVKNDAEAVNDLGRVRAACLRMQQIIDDLMALSQVTLNEMSRASVDASALATGVLAELQKGQPARRVEIRVAPGLMVNADARLLRLALENLLGNAWKFTRDCAVPVIEFGVLNQNGGPAYFVRDNGAGFDMAYSDKLFRPFQRLHNRAEFEGTGIGLATVERIIHRHRGRLWAESQPQKGATFFFTLL
jgi:signal transduction histidine kinase